MQKVIEWQSLMIPYGQAVAELKVKLKSIRDEFREVGEYSPIEFVTGRVKRISSIIQKANKKSIPLDRVEDFLDDIAGIRIMCQLTDDIYKVVELLRKRNNTDLTIMYEKDYVKHVKPSGYRSYHMIIRYPVHTAFGQKNILAEIQIRTLAMNFWSTIDHSINYKYGENIPPNIKSRLISSANSAAKLDQEMQEIKNEIVNSQLLFQMESIFISKITASIKKLKNYGRDDEAVMYQHQLEQIYAEGRLNELGYLYDVISATLPDEI